MKKDETKIDEKIIAWVKGKGGKAIKIHGSPMQEKGNPDILGAFVNRYGHTVHFFVEVKVPGKDADPLQQYRLDEWHNLGFVAEVVHSLDEFVFITDGW